MSNKLHIIVGLGASGFSCAKYLAAQNIPFLVMDTRSAPPNIDRFKSLYPQAEIVTGDLQKSYLDQADTIVLSPGIALTTPAILAQIKRGAKVIGDVELFARAANAPIIAITGTNAKSTVTTLVGEMLKAAGLTVAVGGNLGVPALDLLAPNIDAYVLELSSFQLETTYSLKVKVATVLNVTPDHMDRYATLADYQAAKLKVYDHATVIVANLNDELTYAPVVDYWFTANEPKARTFGLQKSGEETYLAFENEPLLSVNELPVQGKHYQVNALSALAVCYGFGLDFAPMLNVLRTFPGLAHRCQFVRELAGVKWYNDSKGTNVGATLAAIEGLGPELTGKLVLIAGGLGKNADFKPLLPAIQKFSRHVVLIGEAAKELAMLLQDKTPFTIAKTMQEAVNFAAASAKPGDSVLLSPACASYDMFKHFEHRGDVFMEEVNQLT